VIRWLIRAFTRPSNPGRDLAMIGHMQQRDKIKAKARVMRAQMGLPPLSILNHEGN
jgi:hypothetical protein